MFIADLDFLDFFDFLEALDADLDEEDLVFREALETDPEEDLDLCFLETLFPPLTLTFLVGLVF